MYNKHIVLGVGLTALLLGGNLRAQSVYVVKIFDMRKDVTHEVMNREELAKLKQQVQAEGRVFQAALAAAKKEWSASEVHEGESFPGGLSPRRVQEQGPFKPEVAKKKVADLEARAFDNILNATKQKKMSAKEREKMKEKQAREAERDAKLAPAALLLESHIEKLLKGGDKPAADAKAAK
jgi:hypothetical protein